MQLGRSFLGKLTAIIEVLFLSLVTGMASFWLIRIGLPDSSDNYLFVEEGEPDFWAASIAAVPETALMFGIPITAILLLGWLRHRGPASYGLTLGLNGLGQSILIGVALALIASLPAQIRDVAMMYWEFGEQQPFWLLMERVDWDLSFWVFMGITSWFVVPIAEEFYSRGYFQGRLRENFGPAAAIFLAAFAFMTSHSQYHKPDLLNVSLLVTGTFTMFWWGYATYKTGSLIPAIIAHGIGNIPTSDLITYVKLGLSLLLLLVLKDVVWKWLKEVGKLFAEIRDWITFTIAIFIMLAYNMTATLSYNNLFTWLGILGAGFVLLCLRTRANPFVEDR